MGSLSFGSKFATQLALDGYNYLGPTLLLIWTLSPLAGQLSLCLLTIGQAQVRSTSNITYLRSDGQEDQMWAMGYYNPVATLEGSRTSALYDASLFAPSTVKTSPLDIWGHQGS